MPQDKFSLSKKHEKLIEIAVMIPSNRREMSQLGGGRSTIPIDHRGERRKQSYIGTGEYIKRNSTSRYLQ